MSQSPPEDKHIPQPYREKSEPEEPLTDAEMALWDHIFGANMLKGHNNEWAINHADKVVSLRREKFGIR